ncbi:hypothetical protein VF21_10190 [Pseudogymnoascus sp. 05NY08]|nr:hypothetical protein VF21_10190 [Pseudogymnoascus sp. 05NY08]
MSCTSCRRVGKHCSFDNDPPRHRRPGSSEITESDVPDRGGEPGLLANNTVNIQPVEASITLDGEGTFIWDSNNGTFDHDMSYDYLNDKDYMELPTIYERTQDLTGFQEGHANAGPGLNSSAKPLHDSQHVRPGFSTLLYDLDSQLQLSPAGILSDDKHVASVGGLGAVGVLAKPFPVQRPITDEAPSIASLTRQFAVGPRPNTGTNIDSSSERRSEPNTIDQRTEFYGSYFGLSGESDPYLLRHYLYDESNEFPFLRVIYRATETGLQDPTRPGWQTSGFACPTPSSQKAPVPIQFLLTSNELGEEAKKVGPTYSPATPQSTKLELDGLLDDEHGRRLILLFMEYVFPALPVVSRSQLARSTLCLYPSQSQNLEMTPPYLLAAIYASALEFWSYDDVLCVSSVYQKPSSEKLWQMVYDGIQSQIHSPRLATISAALLYSNKVRIGVEHVSADTPFTWTFTASTVALTTSLGLHLDCISWSIPEWEKRLRRRIWWMAFSEEKWRSLLHGHPSIIARDQWNVPGLTNYDFEMDEIEPKQELPAEVETFLKLLHSSGKGSDKGLLSQQIASLALIADNVYTALYTIRAAQSLADDLSASISAIRPLREGLGLWYSRLPAALQLPKKTSSEMNAPIVPNSVACLHFAYLTLKVLLYRALLRPLGSVDFKQDAVESQTGTQNTNGYITGAVTSSDAPDICRNPATLDASDWEHQASFRGQAEAIICAAEKCAILVTNFTAELMSWDFAGFWYSWSRIGWATTSSFLALLLVQSPSIEHATTSKALMDKWRQMLRHQSKSFQDMSLGTLRLDAMYWSDMRKIFRVNRHLEKVLNASI